MVTDTLENRLHIFKRAAEKEYVEESSFMILPRGLATKDDRNYCHLNSLYSDGKKLYVLAHNNSYKTGKKSEVFMYDMGYNKIGVLPTICSSAHNYCRYDDSEFICNSEDGTLLRDNEVAFRCDSGYFTRGLSISDDYITLGSSGISHIREARRHRDGYIYILDREFNKVAKIILPKTQIMDIRRVDKKEYTLSNTE